ncbi:MAG: diphosphomevalonate decarboxylase [Bdellovibrionaceae bacterium]|nr:diphosphomevalonate decarboxylase [Pseudobdellovibrionaceae bacterium]
MWQASAPSNIALIKYMGKRTDGKNLGTNPSLSLTLNHLRSFVTIEPRDGTHDEWEPLDGKMELSTRGREKFLAHFQFLKQQMGVQDQFFLLKSKNDFPSDCGIASSASSFAALTKCACLALGDITKQEVPYNQQAQWSRLGSGSSCRSFYEDFVYWDGAEDIHVLESPHRDFLHQVFIVSSDVKAVSSSEAHQRVSTSLLMGDRSSRVKKRLDELQKLLNATALPWREIYELTWAEFFDMHSLFETSQPPFGYMLPQSVELLMGARQLWQRQDDGPVVTMDAGPNVHLLWRSEQRAMAQKFQQTFSSIRSFTNMEPL